MTIQTALDKANTAKLRTRVSIAADAAHDTNGDGTLDSSDQPGPWRENLHLDGTKASTVTLVGEGGSAGTTLTVPVGSTARVVTGKNNALALEALTVTGGAFTAGNGGGISFEGAFTFSLHDVVVCGNSAMQGGGLYASTAGGTVDLYHVAFRANSLTGAFYGGGAYLQDGVVFLNEVEFDGNTAGYGGGMFMGATTTEPVANLIFTDNVASVKGGGFWIGSVLTLQDSRLERNIGKFGGGGTFENSGQRTVKNVKFAGNTNAAGGAGTNMCLNNSTTSAAFSQTGIARATIYENVAGTATFVDCANPSTASSDCTTPTITPWLPPDSPYCPYSP